MNFRDWDRRPVQFNLGTTPELDAHALQEETGLNLPRFANYSDLEDPSSKLDGRNLSRSN